MNTQTSPGIRERTLRRRRAPVARARIASQPKADYSAVALGLFLVVGTFLLYSPVRQHAFITYDDYQYVVNNPHVVSGLSWQTVAWALTSTEQANWHPLTWLSHALDCQLFGLNAGDHHVVNVMIHTLNVLLLFLLLRQATGAAARSFVAAALFAWHPFNVQSVAWVAERKNLLCTLFFLLTLGAYGWYARRPQFRRLAVVTGVFALALASKPMAVTLPFVLLLVDYWPLQRVANWSEISPRLSIPQQPIRRLLLEKLPLLVLSVASCVATLLAQRATGTLHSLQELSLGVRLENSLNSYVVYLWKTFWPSGFAVFYPHPGPSLPFWKAALAVALLGFVSALVWRQRTHRSYLLVGWLWFLGTLVPVIGLVQVGDQAMADRYAYVPLIGIFVLVVWGIADFLDVRRVGAVPRCALICAVLGAVSFVAFQQLACWKNTQAIWSNALKVTGGDLQVEKKFGIGMFLLDDPEEALPHLVNAAKMSPEDPLVDADLGMCLLHGGRNQEAIHEFERAIKLVDAEPNPGDMEFRSAALLDLGIAYTVSRDYAKALASFREAKQADPTGLDDSMQRIQHSISAGASEIDFLTLSLLLRAKGQGEEASLLLRDVAKTKPQYTNVQELLRDFESDHEQGIHLN